MQRITIYTKDVCIITGRSERQSRYLIEKIKTHYKKEQHQMVTVEEFCTYIGLDPDKVRPYLK
jgi:ribosomal silencing factor RsfS